MSSSSSSSNDNKKRQRKESSPLPLRAVYARSNNNKNANADAIKKCFEKIDSDIADVEVLKAQVFADCNTVLQSTLLQKQEEEVLVILGSQLQTLLHFRDPTQVLDSKDQVLSMDDVYRLRKYHFTRSESDPQEFICDNAKRSIRGALKDVGKWLDRTVAHRRLMQNYITVHKLHPLLQTAYVTSDSDDDNAACSDNDACSNVEGSAAGNAADSDVCKDSD